MKVLVTGATGFVGEALVTRLAADPTLRVIATARRGGSGRLPTGVAAIEVADIGPTTDWSDALSGIDVIVHAAGRAHILHDVQDSLPRFRAINTDGTITLARQAAAAGVRRFVFISSIKVSGERTEPGRPYLADDPPAPADPYGLSKREAEDGLRDVARETGLEVTILRPVLVYGPGVKGNFHSILRLLKREIPLPFGAIANRRSLVALDNLTDILALCVAHPAASNQTFLVSDGEDLSTTDLLRRIGAALGARVRLVPVSERLLDRTLRMLGNADLANRLCGSLQVDLTKTRDLLGWSPVVSVDHALRETARDFLGRAPDHRNR